jgi:DNA polymerase III delta prime subunit
MKVILFNGPPGSGKDTLAAELSNKLSYYDMETINHKFAYAIKKPVKEMFNLTDKEYNKYFESPEKDEPQTRFQNKTPREVLISFSEKWAKPLFGKRIFGTIAGQYIVNNYLKDIDFVIFSDCGFEEEVKGLADYVGEANIVVFNLFRENTGFKNDSRNYVQNVSKYEAVVQNNSTPGEVVENQIIPFLESIDFLEDEDYIPF